MRIYRIEHLVTGTGPFNSISDRDWWTDALYGSALADMNGWPYFPQVVARFGRNRWEFDKSARAGFASWSDLVRHLDLFYDKLRGQGFVVRIYEARDFVKCRDGQVVFNIDLSTKQHFVPIP
jgi:hypothetical protein